VAGKINDVTAIIPNRKTLKLTRGCLESLLRFYPGIEVCLVDNGSADKSLQYCHSVAREYANVRLFQNKTRLAHHAVALNIGVKNTQTRYFLTVDSDTRLLDSGLLERMIHKFDDPLVFAVGHVEHGAATNCIRAPKHGEPTTDFVHPFFAMWDRDKFIRISAKFDVQGQPTCRACKLALANGFTFADILGLHTKDRKGVGPVQHFGGGTRAVLGWLQDERKGRHAR
jgi:glycosyltransferase involved in cell wall biosynthesis